MNSNSISKNIAEPTDGGLAASDAITKKLRTYYASVQDQAIPEKFLDLLEKLDQVEKSQTGKPE